MTPHDKLCAAIAIIQDHVLATETSLDPSKVFDHGRFETASLELAAHLLGELLEVVERVDRRN